MENKFIDINHEDVGYVVGILSNLDFIKSNQHDFDIKDVNQWLIYETDLSKIIECWLPIEIKSSLGDYIITENMCQFRLVVELTYLNEKNIEAELYFTSDNKNVIIENIVRIVTKKLLNQSKKEMIEIAEYFSKKLNKEGK